MSNTAPLAIEPRQAEKQEMLELLDVVRARIESGEAIGLLIVQMIGDLKGTKLDTAGHLVIADTIGYLEILKLHMYCESAGIGVPE